LIKDFSDLAAMRVFAVIAGCVLQCTWRFKNEKADDRSLESRSSHRSFWISGRCTNYTSKTMKPMKFSTVWNRRIGRIGNRIIVLLDHDYFYRYCISTNS
jgi:hypothetical protein